MLSSTSSIEIIWLKYSFLQNSEWNGLLITDPFNTPEAVVEVYIDGVSSLGENVIYWILFFMYFMIYYLNIILIFFNHFKAGLKGKNFPLVVDEYEPDTYDAIKHRINQRFTNGGNKLINIRLSEPDDVSEINSFWNKLKKILCLNVHFIYIFVVCSCYQLLMPSEKLYHQKYLNKHCNTWNMTELRKITNFFMNLQFWKPWLLRYIF